MKFQALVLFSLLIISDLAFGTTRTWRITTASPTTLEDIENIEGITTTENVVPVSSNFTEAITKTIAQILKDFRSHLYEWIKNKIWFNDGDTVTTSLSLEEDDYLITFSNIQIEERHEYGILPQISCEFSNNLKIEMPFRGTKLRFQGDIRLQSTTNVSLIENNHFNIYFNGMSFSMTTKLGLSIGQAFPNNFTEIDISYSNSNIDMTTNHHTESVTTKALSSLIDEIQSYLKSMIEEELAIITQDKVSFYQLFAVCMHPENELSRNHQHFTTNKQNYYYTIGQKINDLGDSITLHTDTIKIKGLQNLKSLSVYRYSDFPSFSLKIVNVTGESGWKYASDGIGPLEFTPLQFTISHISIEGTLSQDKWRMNIHGNTGPVVISSNFSDTATSLIQKILEKRLQTIIVSSITELLSETYLQI